MSQFYIDFVNFCNNFMCPIFGFVSLISVPPIGSSGFEVFTTVFSWLAFFHNPIVFPLWFTVSLDSILVARFVSWVIQFVRWFLQLIHIW